MVNNPNNWHWVDKNCIDWTRQYFKEKLIGLKGPESCGDFAEITSVVSVEGDVVVSQRKGKVISLFDLKLVLGYEGKIGESTAKGSISIPEVAYDTEEDEFSFNISVYNESDENTKIKPVIKAQLIPKLRQVLRGFGKDLLSTHGSDIQLPSDKVNSKLTKENQSKLECESGTKPASIVASSKASSSTSATMSNKTSSSTPVSGASSNVPKYNTSTLHFEPAFNTTAEQLYITMLEKNRLGAWTRSNPLFEGDFLKEGQDFELFGGNVEGKIVKLKTCEKIEQLWRLKTWKSGHFAKLSIDFYQGDSETKLNVLFDGIPIGEEDAVQGNFEDYYIRSIKITFGFGAVL